MHPSLSNKPPCGMRHCRPLIRCVLALLLVVAATPACTSSDAAPSASNAAMARAGSPASAMSIDGGLVTQADDPPWQKLIDGEWTLPAGSEDYYCIRHTTGDELYINEFSATNPPGTHHTFLTMGEPSGPDGVTKCDATENQKQMVFGSGPGSNPVKFPEGVALKLNKGTQLLLNLHLFNVRDAPLSGVSGVNVIAAEAGRIENIARAFTASLHAFTLPAKEATSMAGECVLSTDATMFGLTPHMHQLGVHMKVAADPTGRNDVLHDAAYDFDTQLFYPIEPRRLSAGDRVQFECSWNNASDRDVVWGQSSLDEMCSVGLFVYPASDNTGCVHK
jgi:hypothetical protein